MADASIPKSYFTPVVVPLSDTVKVAFIQNEGQLCAVIGKRTIQADINLYLRSKEYLIVSSPFT